ncbi:unnamed protein product [Urochloa decumbens]|uniref:F-box domain-containing protein n=1 Tax=Urochloa decumbens TaxID=240449 RepID=A0ABC8YFM4_9POAL
MDQATDLSALLPDDVLADVLRRLPPRHLAVSRSVCTAWRAAIDADGTLLKAKESLPLSLAGLLIKYNWSYHITEFFARPSRTKKGPSAIAAGKRDFLAEGEIGAWSTVLDHCNGLLLTYGDDGDDDEGGLCVINPATRRRARVPPCPPPRIELARTVGEEYLAYDPSVSPHYQIFSLPYFVTLAHDKFGDEVDRAVEESEWPPATYITHVFSSVTGQWEERSFVREGEAAGTVADMRKHCSIDRCNAVYRRGELYVHGQTDFFMRISLSKDKYQVIKPPVICSASFPEPSTFSELYLGKSEKGLYCSSIQGECRLQVWILHEITMEWVLKHDRDLLPLLMKNNLKVPCHDYNKKVHGPWILQDINYNYKKDVGMKAIVRNRFAWSSDASDDDDETSECRVDKEGKNFNCGYFDILGFHPYKEIIFLSQSIKRGLAYHLNGSTIQDLGYLYPKGYDQQLPNEQLIESSFPYTPCWIELI